MTSLFSKSVTAILTTTLMSSMVLAWGDLGHQTVGEIAQRHLSPKGKKLVSYVLGQGPLAEAGTFPDLVRSDEDYKEFANFHFVEIDPRYNGRYDKIPAALLEKIDANSLISGIPEKLFSGIFALKFSKNQKQDLMRYLVHLVGDVHQPLHVGNGYDRGANFCDVKYKIGKGEKAVQKSTNLHSFWDTTLVEEIFYAQKEKNPDYKIPGWKGYKELADLIIADQKHLVTEEVMSTPALDWYQESQALHSKVYIDKDSNVAASEREYCRRLVKDENGKNKKDSRGVDIVIPKTKGAEAEATPEYMREATEIVKGRIMKAGLRLAYTINQMADKHYTNEESVEDYDKKKVEELKEILVEFENRR